MEQLLAQKLAQPDDAGFQSPLKPRGPTTLAKVLGQEFPSTLRYYVFHSANLNIEAIFNIHYCILLSILRKNR
ncbi:hypothetical protein DBV15_11620 [Temnothorax longispinosus]|uniref:Uncharacterized protein n=1 Tax=Temnothorax longispinosus TaxID=300112 RepID=A0A4S2KS08_9HYME|nr:hypothetical protein DBV15_11620 [Temnothorax longispinosus]